jgi:hypothetical protein
VKDTHQHSISSTISFSPYKFCYLPAISDTLLTRVGINELSDLTKEYVALRVHRKFSFFLLVSSFKFLRKRVKIFLAEL